VKQESLLFGEELRRRRLTAGLTLAQLAGLVHYSKAQISKVERGMKPPSRDLARLCDSTLQADGALASLIQPVSAGAGRMSSQSEGATTGDGSDGWLIELSTGGQSRIRSMTRRQITSAETLVFPSTLISKASVAWSRDSAEPANIFRTLFEQYRQLGQVTDPGFLVPTLVAQTHALQELSKASAKQTSKDLLVLGSRYAEYIGWLVQETGNDPAALWWTRRAVDLANAGGDPGFAAYGRVRHALVTLYRGDADTTIQLARAAQMAGASRRVRGLAALREAQGHALACDHDASMLALERASILLSARGAEVEQPLVGTSNLTDPAEMVRGWCLLDLGQPRVAAEVLDQQLATVPKGAIRTRLRYGTRRALAYATAGEVDHACELAAGLLEDAACIRSATIAKDLRALARTLGRYQKSKSVRDLAPRLGTTLRVATP
jgi:transcriptional regulator with XRE-family HTH domain